MDAAKERIAPPARRLRLASVRVSPGNYLAAACLLTFVATLLLRAQHDVAALVTIALAWIVTPLLAFTDRISFDGRVLARRARSHARQIHQGARAELEIEDIERVETSAVANASAHGRVHIAIAVKSQAVAVASSSLRRQRLSPDGADVVSTPWL